MVCLALRREGSALPAPLPPRGSGPLEPMSFNAAGGGGRSAPSACGVELIAVQEADASWWGVQGGEAPLRNS